jgi:hypothetical protein
MIFNLNQFRVPFDFNFRCLNGSQRSSYSYTCICKIMTNTGPIRSSPKEKLAKYIRCTYSRWQIVNIPIVSRNENILRNRD